MLNDSNLERASEDAVRYSKLSSMAELRKEYKLEKSPPMMYEAYGAPPMMYASRAPPMMEASRAYPMARPMVFAMAAAPTILYDDIIPMAKASQPELDDCENVANEDIQSEPELQAYEPSSPSISDDRPLPPPPPPTLRSISDISGISEADSDSYSIVNNKISIQQSERMVQKILNRNKSKFT